MTQEQFETLFKEANELFALAENETDTHKQAKLIGKAEGIAHAISLLLKGE